MKTVDRAYATIEHDAVDLCAPLAVPDPDAHRSTLERVRAGQLVTVTLAASGGVHAGIVPAHLVEAGPRMAGALAATALVLVVLAFLTRGPAVAPRTTFLSVAVLCAIAGAYLLSRTVGLPILQPEPEAFDWLGTLTTAVEVLAAVTATALLIHARKGRS